MPKELDGKTFADFNLGLNPKMRRALQLAKDVASGESWCALLIGDPGLGKSLLASAALSESVHQKPGYFWEWGALLRSFKADLFPLRDGEKATEEELLRPWQEGAFLLVIDDVGAEKVTDWTKAMMYAIVDARRVKQLPTIITTNDDRAIDDRVLDRMFKWSVTCEGESVRRR